MTTLAGRSGPSQDSSRSVAALRCPNRCHPGLATGLLLGCALVVGRVMADLPVWLPVTAEGLHAVAFADLGLMDPIPSRELALTLDGQAVAIELEDGGDGAFGPGDRLIFYGRPMPRSDPRNRYTGAAVYRLARDANQASRMMIEPGIGSRPDTVPLTSTQTTVYRGEDTRYWQAMPVTPGRSEDHWFWGDAVGKAVRSFTIDLPDADAKTPFETLRLRLRRVAPAASFSIDVRFNGQDLPRQSWPAEGRLEFQVPTDAFKESGNLIEVSATSDNAFYVDSIEVDYARRLVAREGRLEAVVPVGGSYHIVAEGFTPGPVRVYDVTNPLAPERLPLPQELGAQRLLDVLGGQGAERRLLLVGPVGMTALPGLVMRTPIDEGLHGGQGADYVVITDEVLRPGLDRLLAHRQAQGLSTRVVTTAAIFDAFGAGHRYPGAIRAFLRHAYAHWQPRPRYVLLAGDGHLDYRDNYQTHEPNHVPPWLVEMAAIGQVPSDNAYADVDDDGLPDMAIGRIPAKTPEELGLARRGRRR